VEFLVSLVTRTNVWRTTSRRHREQLNVNKFLLHAEVFEVVASTSMFPDNVVPLCDYRPPLSSVRRKKLSIFNPTPLYDYEEYYKSGQTKSLPDTNAYSIWIQDWSGETAEHTNHCVTRCCHSLRKHQHLAHVYMGSQKCWA